MIIIIIKIFTITIIIITIIIIMSNDVRQCSQLEQLPRIVVFGQIIVVKSAQSAAI